MPDQQLEELFAAFYRLDADAKELSAALDIGIQRLTAIRTAQGVLLEALTRRTAELERRETSCLMN